VQPQSRRRIQVTLRPSSLTPKPPPSTPATTDSESPLSHSKAQLSIRTARPTR
jgi:hypothetical protein